MATRSKELAFDVTVGPDGRALLPEGDPLNTPDSWTPEHLLLTALARCTLASLRYAARRVGVDVSAATSAHGTVSRREDGRFAFTRVELEVDLHAAPGVTTEALKELATLTERGCFIGASLATPPRYTWTVAGQAPHPAQE